MKTGESRKEKPGEQVRGKSKLEMGGIDERMVREGAEIPAGQEGWSGTSCRRLDE